MVILGSELVALNANNGLLGISIVASCGNKVERLNNSRGISCCSLSAYINSINCCGVDFTRLDLHKDGPSCGDCMTFLSSLCTLVLCNCGCCLVMMVGSLGLSYCLGSLSRGGCCGVLFASRWVVCPCCASGVSLGDLFCFVICFSGIGCTKYVACCHVHSSLSC